MKRFLFAVAFALLAHSAAAQEAIALTTPVPAPPAIASYVPGSLTITVTPAPRITVTLVATDGTMAPFNYPCGTPCAYDTDAKVLTLITALNTANLSTRSLWRRVFDRLVVDFPSRFAGGATVQ